MLFDSNTAKEVVKGLLQSATQFIRENPALTAWAVAATSGAALLAAPGAAAALLLNFAGFTGTGVQSGSLAAAAHSIIGNVAAGSMFSFLQSAGAGGAAALGTINGVIQAAGAAMFGSGAGMTYLKSNVSNSTTNGP
ncbi:conserved hypothetical protein [Talaromyces stipitatus ATCC 10500]|uniref:Uncharacterized protein n=1 Tax=Talaromyces stipitatus (strain ATCC 10500 / CBS 375.48 / QM 6759 / NRRL 1006) TaxID=441959 RepID=B8M679_TALSN|nr:uncharacterized protein TSTA_024120 [Talaromyces stipitatus ATCC 10500]EED19079.1 conserved hypothetical protein [Talaromyces stipitatus ATCC 10500]